MDERQKKRRTLVAGAATAGAVAVAASVLPGQQAAAPESADAGPRPEPSNGGRYQATAHVLRYYQTARI